MQTVLKMYDKTNIDFGFGMISWIIKSYVCVIRPSLQLQQITQTSALMIYDIILNLIQ